MTVLSPANYTSFVELSTNYQRRRWWHIRWWFFPESIAIPLKAFTQNPTDDNNTTVAKQLIDAVLNLGWLFNLFTWFYGGFFNSAFMSSCVILSEAKLLNPTNFDRVASHDDPVELDAVLRDCQQTGLLTGTDAQANFNAVVARQTGLFAGTDVQTNFNAVAIQQGLIVLEQACLLTGADAAANRNAVVSHQQPRALARALVVLQQRGLLTGTDAQANFNAVATLKWPLITPDEVLPVREETEDDARPIIVADALTVLQQAGLLAGADAEANRNSVAGHTAPGNVAEALVVMHQAGLLIGQDAEANRNAIARAPCSFARAMRSLQKAGLLTGSDAQVNFNAVTRHQDPWQLGDAVSVLLDTGLLTGVDAQVNFNAAASQQQLGLLSFVLGSLQKAGLLTGAAAQVNFNHLITFSPILFSSVESRDAWRDMPDHFFRNNAQRFQDIIAICQRDTQSIAERQAAFVRYVRQALGTQHEGRVVVNKGQSTHTASVHVSTDATALMLSQLYATQMPNVNACWVELQDGMKKALLPNQVSQVDWDIQKQHAQACLDRIQNVAINIEIIPEKKHKALALLRTQEGKDIETLCSRLETNQEKTTTLTLQQFIALLWEATKGKSNQVEAFVGALYEIQRGYNLDESGRDDRQVDSLSICYGGTANKFIEKLQGLSPYIVFVFVNANTISLGIQQALLNYLLKRLDLLSQQNPEEFCQWIDKLEEDSEVTSVYQAIFDEPSFQQLIREQFAAAEEELLTKTFETFANNVLPYLPTIDIKQQQNAVYSAEFMKQFKLFHDRRQELATTVEQASSGEVNRNAFFQPPSTGEASDIQPALAYQMG